MTKKIINPKNKGLTTFCLYYVCIFILTFILFGGLGNMNNSRVTKTFTNIYFYE